MIASLARTLGIAALAAGALVVVDGALARAERQEAALVAARFYGDGQRMAHEHRFGAATDAFRSAIASERNNSEYPLALGQTLLDAGELDEAGSTLTELLTNAPMSGAANLAMARVLARQGRTEESAFYYHRAIYGQWPGGGAAEQRAARMELAGLLAEHGSPVALLAELLPLQEQTPSSDRATLEKLANWYLMAGSDSRAEAILKSLHEKPPDVDAAPATEPYEQSIQTMRSVVLKVLQCAALAQDKATTDLLAEFNTRAKQLVQPGEQAQASAANLALAKSLWRREKTGCPGAITVADKPLRRSLRE